MQEINLDIFNKIIACRGDNLHIFSVILNGEILRKAMISIVETMTEDLEDWEFEFVIKPDNMLWEGKQKEFYQGRAILNKNTLENLVSYKLGMELTENDRLKLRGKLKLNEIETAGLYKLLRYRFLNWEEKAFLKDKEDNTKNLGGFGFLLTKFHDIRGMCAHNDKNLYDSFYMITYIEDILACVADAKIQVEEKIINGSEIAKKLDEFKYELEAFLEAFKLTVNNQPINRESSEEYGAEYLYGFDKVFIAYLSCKDDNYIKFITGRLLPLMIKGLSNLTIDSGTVNYLSELCNSKDQYQAQVALTFVKELENDMKEYVNFTKNVSSIEDVHYTDSFVRKLSSSENSICVITDDEVLEGALIKLPENIICLNVTDREHVSPFHGKIRKTHVLDRKNEISLRESEEVLFKVPESGASVYYGNPVKNTQYKLRNLIGSGGEGSVFTTDIGTECFKIYHSDKISAERNNKIYEMLKIKEKIPKNIGWPIEQIFESSNRHTAVGFSMTDINTVSNERFISIEELIIRLQARDELFCEWDRKKLIKLCMEILLKLKALHDQKVLVGDVNPGNIMTDRNANIFFTDIDSCQIGEYLSNVGRIEFASPRILKRSSGFRNIKRTIDDENYAVAVLLYYILTVGKYPYDLEGEGLNSVNIKDAINKKRFKNFDTEGADHIWDNFTENVRDIFRDTFYNREKNNGISSDNIWLNAFSEMEKDIYDGKKGSLSNELFPSDGACKKGVTWSKKECARCGKDFDVSNNISEKLCDSCRKVKIFNKSIIYKRTCSICGRCFTENLWDAAGENGDVKPEKVLCPDCNHNARLCGEVELEQTEFKKTFAAIKENYRMAERELEKYD